MNGLQWNTIFARGPGFYKKRDEWYWCGVGLKRAVFFFKMVRFSMIRSCINGVLLVIKYYYDRLSNRMDWNLCLRSSSKRITKALLINNPTKSISPIPDSLFVRDWTNLIIPCQGEMVPPLVEKLESNKASIFLATVTIKQKVRETGGWLAFNICIVTG